jgi:hypothetical protein
MLACPLAFSPPLTATVRLALFLLFPQFRISKGGVNIVNVPLIAPKATKTASASRSAKVSPSPKPSNVIMVQVGQRLRCWSVSSCSRHDR